MIDQARHKNYSFSHSIRKQQRQHYFRSQRKPHLVSQDVLKHLLSSQPNPYYINLISHYIMMNRWKLKQNCPKQVPFAEYLCVNLLWLNVDKLLVCGYLLDMIKLLNGWLKMEGLDKSLICCHEIEKIIEKLDEVGETTRECIKQELYYQIQMLRRTKELYI